MNYINEIIVVKIFFRGGQLFPILKMHPTLNGCVRYRLKMLTDHTRAAFFLGYKMLFSAVPCYFVDR